jgi:hypothetical protein
MNRKKRRANNLKHFFQFRFFFLFNSANYDLIYEEFYLHVKSINLNIGNIKKWKLEAEQVIKKSLINTLGIKKNIRKDFRPMGEFCESEVL